MYVEEITIENFKKLIESQPPDGGGSTRYFNERRITDRPLAEGGNLTATGSHRWDGKKTIWISDYGEIVEEIIF